VSEEEEGGRGEKEEEGVSSTKDSTSSVTLHCLVFFLPSPTPPLFSLYLSLPFSLPLSAPLPSRMVNCTCRLVYLVIGICVKAPDAGISGSPSLA
jgi:hypothetical protein